MEWRIRPTGDDATIAWQGKRIAELETRLADLDRIITNIRIHFERLCTDDLREHGYIAHDHDIDFQVFRALCGYKEALVEKVELQEAARWER